MTQKLQKSISLRWSSLNTPQTRILIGLMAPSVMVGMDVHMFGVALPALRDAFDLNADVAAWTSMAYSLPFMALMPLYGRLGDGLGKRRLILTGICIFLIGTVLVLGASSLPMYIVGRAIQGIGTAGFVPLSIAIIAQWFEPEERGKVMGAWNSIIPLVGLTVPFLGGLLVDAYGWRAIYPPVAVAGVLALFVVRQNVPTLAARTVDPRFLRTFDWLGVLLLSSALVTLLFFTSSRPITGVDGLRDWRLLLLCLALFALLIVWERRREQPYVNLGIFRNDTFTATSISAGLRMFLMSSITFVMPLYLTDIHGLSASRIGIALALQAGALFTMSRAGGQLADRWGTRRPVLFSMGALLLLMIALALLPATAPVWALFAIATAHGFVIGLSLAPLHRSSMHGISEAETGGAAGLYSMFRFAGQILGVSVAGVVLQQGEQAATVPITAYQAAFWLYAVMAVLATVITLRIRS